MARVRSNIFGITGKIGDKVYKIRNGRTFVTRLPEKFTTPMDFDSIRRREKFSITQKFSMAVNKIPSLHLLWKKYFKKGEVHNKLFSHYYKRIVKDYTDNCRIVPETAFLCEIKNFMFLNKKITVVLNPIGENSQIWPPNEIQICMHGVLTLFDPDAEIKLKYLCFPVSSAAQLTDLVNELTFEAHLTSIIDESINKYPFASLHIVFVTTGAGGMPVRNSQNFFMRLKEAEAPEASV